MQNDVLTSPTPRQTFPPRCTEGVLDAGLAERMLNWRHSGFSVHNRVRSKAADAKGRQHLARYMIRCPFALEKMRYDKKSGMVIYRSRLHATLKRNYQLMPVLSNASSNT